MYVFETGISSHLAGDGGTADPTTGGTHVSCKSFLSFSPIPSSSNGFPFLSATGKSTAGIASDTMQNAMASASATFHSAVLGAGVMVAPYLPDSVKDLMRESTLTRLSLLG